MQEHYIEHKVDDLEESNIEVVLRMERHNTMARIMNQLHSHLEKETQRFKHEMTRRLMDVLEKEL
jgi:hypothetical protein